MSVIIADAARWLVLSGGQRAGQRAEPAMGNLLSVPEMAEGHRIRARLAPGEQAKESATATEAVLLLMQLPSLTEPSCVALLLLIALLLAHLGDARSMVPMWIFLGCGIVLSGYFGIGVLLRAWRCLLDCTDLPVVWYCTSRLDPSIRQSAPTTRSALSRGPTRARTSRGWADPRGA